MKTDRSPALEDLILQISQEEGGEGKTFSDMCSLMAYIKQFNI